MNDKPYSGKFLDGKKLTVHKYFGNIILETTLSFIRIISETMHIIFPSRIEVIPLHSNSHLCSSGFTGIL